MLSCEIKQSPNIIKSIYPVVFKILQVYMSCLKMNKLNFFMRNYEKFMIFFAFFLRIS